MKHRHGHRHDSFQVRENPSWQWSMGLQPNKKQVQTWVFGGAEITVQRQRQHSHHSHHAKRHSTHSSTVAKGFSMAPVGGPQFPPVKPHRPHGGSSHRINPHGRPHTGPVLEHYKRVTEQHRKQADARRRNLENTNRLVAVAANANRLTRPTERPSAANKFDKIATTNHFNQHRKANVIRPDLNRILTPRPKPPSVKPPSPPVLKPTPRKAAVTFPGNLSRPLSRASSRFPEEKLRELNESALTEQQQHALTKQVAGKQGPTVAEVPETIAGVKTGRTLQFFTWSNGRNISIMSPRDLPIGHTTRGEWWIYFDGIEVQIGKRYSEDPATVRLEIERSGLRNPSQHDVKNRVEAGKELNRDIEVFLRSGKSLEQSLQETRKVHEELSQMLGIAFFNALAAKVNIDSQASNIIEAGEMLGRKFGKLFARDPQFGAKRTDKPLRGGLEVKLPAEAGRVAERVWARIVASPQNPGPKGGGRFATPYKPFVEPDFAPAVNSKGEIVFGKEPTYARIHNEPSIKDALLIADSKYRGFFNGSPPQITFSLLGKEGSQQVMGMIYLAQMTKGKTFVLLGREGQTIGHDIRQFAKALNVTVEIYGHPLVK